ncbi:DUF6461 domain-containing protein [Streptomyces qinglanensis]|uniref:DUF6461 domain-containing protein n=1 Tax=Streptomyces qinglanensis TaxID=943816 RepID=UPI001112F4A9|nr:DUF6461 domain-containing protein [Streptomyces qinglanensis]
MTPTLTACVHLESFGITCVRDLTPDEVLSRLGVADQAPYPQFTDEAAMGQFGHGFELPAVRVCASGGWTFLLDVEAHGRLLQSPVLTRLSRGAEAVSVWKLLSHTTQVSHARDGELLAEFDAWMFEPAEGADPVRLNHALSKVGFFVDEDSDSDDCSDPEMALLALEREFGLALSPELARGPLPTVSLPHLKD